MGGTEYVVPERIEVVGGDQLILTWPDASQTELSARQLRAGCGCAECREPAGEAATRALLAGAAPIAIVSARVVGNYALSFEFAPDGHGTGIYPFALLKQFDGGGAIDE